jgi:hypothetical protein
VRRRSRRRTRGARPRDAQCVWASRRSHARCGRPTSGRRRVGTPQVVDNGHKPLFIRSPADLQTHRRDRPGAELGPVHDALPRQPITEQVVHEGRTRRQGSSENRLQQRVTREHLGPPTQQQHRHVVQGRGQAQQSWIGSLHLRCQSAGPSWRSREVAEMLGFHLVQPRRPRQRGEHGFRVADCISGLKTTVSGRQTGVMITAGTPLSTPF